MSVFKVYGCAVSYGCPLTEERAFGAFVISRRKGIDTNMNCKHCGKTIKADAAVCPHCGKALTQQPKMVSLSEMSAKHAKKKSPLNKKERILRVALIVAAAVLALLVAGTTLLWALLEGNIQRGSELSGDIGVNELLSTKDVQNIALFGLDDRDSSADGHSDAIIIVSIDRKHDKIKMTSIARDSLVPVEGYRSVDGKTKITHAFSKGGVNLAVKTLNQNFGMNITDYAYVNFIEFAEIIDYIGGVTINVEQREMAELNNHIYWMGIECNMTITKVKQAGVQRLSGGQALAYARVRKIDSDIQRGNRQRDVLQAMFNEVKTLPLTKFPGLVAKLLKMCHTNMTSSELMSIATWALTNSPEFMNFSLPSEECNAWGGTHQDHGWVWIYDLNYATRLLHNFVYEQGEGVSVSRTTTYIAKKTTSTTAPTSSTGTTAVTTATSTTTTRPPVNSSDVSGDDQQTGGKLPSQDDDTSSVSTSQTPSQSVSSSADGTEDTTASTDNTTDTTVATSENTTATTTGQTPDEPTE